MRIVRDLRVDMVRSLAMIMVIGFHVGVLWWGERLMYPRSWSELWLRWSSVDFNGWYLVAVMGDQAVPCFVFVSGYLLAMKREKLGLSWLQSRVWKVLVPYWIALLLGSVLVSMAWKLAPVVLDRTVAGEFSWDRVLWAFLLIQNFYSYTFNSPLPALWFVPMLVQLYLFVPLLLGWLERLDPWDFLKRVLRIQLVWNVIALGFWAFGIEVLWGYFSGLGYLSVLAVGMWFERVERKEVRLRSLLVWGLVIWLLGWSLRFFGNRLFMMAEALIGMGWFVVLRIVAVGWLRCWKRGGVWLAGVGRSWSYWIYLVHQPVLYLGFALAYWWGLRW